MAATATQDDDLIIFNDEAEDETQATSSGSGASQGDDDSNDDSATQNDGDDLITFESDDDDTPTNVEESNDLIIDEDTSVNLEPTSTSEELKAELIDVQDKPELTSFDDMGIDLEKLGDKEGENLKGIDTTEETKGNETDFGFDIDESANEEVKGDKDIDDDIGSIEDFASSFADSDIDESTLIGILEATILKVTKREEIIGEQISKKEEDIGEIRGEIEHLKINYRVKEGEIAELQAEREKIIKTREGIEKMKQDS